MTSVPQSEVPQSPFLWTRGIAARETLRYLDRNGVDAEPVLLRRSVSQDWVTRTRRNGRISAPKLPVV